jgi:hypothetical protein
MLGECSTWSGAALRWIGAGGFVQQQPVHLAMASERPFGLGVLRVKAAIDPNAKDDGGDAVHRDSGSRDDP